MKFTFAALVALCIGCCFGLSAEDTIVDQGTGQVFPREISFDAAGQTYHLQATGVATRKKFFAKVYSIASYIQDPADLQGDKFKAILADNKAKQLTIKWVRDVDAKKVEDAYHEGFKKALSPQEFDQLRPQIEQFLGYFKPNVHKGDEYILRWLPGGHVQVILDGEPTGEIENEEFARGLWAIWFGEKSVIPDRTALISLIN